MAWLEGVREAGARSGAAGRRRRGRQAGGHVAAELGDVLERDAVAQVGVYVGEVGRGAGLERVEAREQVTLRRLQQRPRVRAPRSLGAAHLGGYAKGGRDALGDGRIEWLYNPEVATTDRPRPDY